MKIMSLAQRAAELYYMAKKPSIGKRSEVKRTGMKVDPEEGGTGKKFRKM
jgi:hypothetical protein